MKRKDDPGTLRARERSDDDDDDDDDDGGECDDDDEEDRDKGQPKRKALTLAKAACPNCKNLISVAQVEKRRSCPVCATQLTVV